MVEDLTSSGPGASLHAPWSILAYSRWHMHQCHDSSEADHLLLFSHSVNSDSFWPHDCSTGKESTGNAGDSGSIPGLGRPTGEGIGYPLQYSWVSLVDQLVKNPPAMRETWVRSLCWEDSLEKGKATHSSILPWRIPWAVLSRGSQKVRHDWATFTFTVF